MSSILWPPGTNRTCSCSFGQSDIDDENFDLRPSFRNLSTNTPSKWRSIKNACNMSSTLSLVKAMLTKICFPYSSVSTCREPSSLLMVSADSHPFGSKRERFALVRLAAGVGDGIAVGVVDGIAIGNSVAVGDGTGVSGVGVAAIGEGAGVAVAVRS